jgi:hypothetical protein
MKLDIPDVYYAQIPWEKLSRGVDWRQTKIHVKINYLPKIMTTFPEVKDEAGFKTRVEEVRAKIIDFLRKANPKRELDRGLDNFQLDLQKLPEVIVNFLSPNFDYFGGGIERKSVDFMDYFASPVFKEIGMGVIFSLVMGPGAISEGVHMSLDFETVNSDLATESYSQEFGVSEPNEEIRTALDFAHQVFSDPETQLKLVGYTEE